MILVLVLAVAVIFLFFILIKYSPENAESDKDIVLDVIDGDTFRLENGEAVRLICVDAPEKSKKGYEDAKEFLSFLILNKEVRLEKDVSDRDAYGRLLRYVYVLENNKEIFVNKKIVQQGYADVFAYGNDTSKCNEIEKWADG